MDEVHRLDDVEHAYIGPVWGLNPATQIRPGKSKRGAGHWHFCVKMEVMIGSEAGHLYGTTVSIDKLLWYAATDAVVPEDDPYGQPRVTGVKSTQAQIALDAANF